MVEDWEDPSSDPSSAGLDKGDAYSDVGAVVSAPAPKSHFLSSTKFWSSIGGSPICEPSEGLGTPDPGPG